MNRIATRFQELKARGESAFIPFITGGDPSLAASEDIAVVLAESGADVIEYGAPFSDPSGDGPVIQEASLRALNQGVTLHGILSSVERIRKRSQAPLLIFTYYNPILAWGKRLARDAANAGADGVLCVDLPPDDAVDYRSAMAANDLSTVFWRPHQHRRTTCADRSACDTRLLHFGWGHGRTRRAHQDLSQAVARVRQKTGKPVAVGFGISTPEQARTVSSIAEGVVVGSAIVRLIAQSMDAADAVKRVRTFAGELNAAIKGK